MIRNKILRWLFPAECLGCGEALPGSRDLLCSFCFSHLELIPPHLYCEDCFAEKDEWMACKKNHMRGVHVGAAFEEEGPASALLRCLVALPDSRYEKLLASFLLLQMQRFRWPAPDIVLPMTGERHTFLFRNATFSDQLARAFAGLFGLRVKRSFTQRVFCDKNIYLIGDTVPSPNRIKQMANEIFPLNPKRIFFLNLLRK